MRNSIWEISIEPARKIHKYFSEFIIGHNLLSFFPLTSMIPISDFHNRSVNVLVRLHSNSKLGLHSAKILVLGSPTALIQSLNAVEFGICDLVTLADSCIAVFISPYVSLYNRVCS